jgi:hypothetical protein
MARSSIKAMLVMAGLIASCAACSSGTNGSDQTSIATTGSAPSSEWLAVVASAEDPNDLDGRRADVVAALGSDDGHIVVSPGACFTGLPQRYDALYVLALNDATRDLVEGRLRSLATDPAWIGEVTSTCLD